MSGRTGAQRLVRVVEDEEDEERANGLARLLLLLLLLLLDDTLAVGEGGRVVVLEKEVRGGRGMWTPSPSELGGVRG